jgi:hypothetical protein
MGATRRLAAMIALLLAGAGGVDCGGPAAGGPRAGDLGPATGDVGPATGDASVEETSAAPGEVAELPAAADPSAPDAPVDEPESSAPDAPAPDPAAPDAPVDVATHPDPGAADVPKDPGQPASADDGTPTRQACTGHFGSGLTATHGRLDGYLVAIVRPGASGCNADSDHVHLQVRMGGEIYDVAVNVGGSSAVLFREWDGPLDDGAWAEGWHPGDALDYVSLGLHSDDFTTTAMDALTAEITADLDDANHLSVFATGYGSDGIHLVHRNGDGDDGAIVVDPLAATSRYLLFNFPDQSF